MGPGVVVETATADAATTAGSYLERKGYKTLPVTRVGIRAFFKVPENYHSIVPSDLLKVLCIRNVKHGLRDDSLQYESSSSTRLGGDSEGKKVVRHWVDIDPDAIEVLKKTSWHLKTA